MIILSKKKKLFGGVVGKAAAPQQGSFVGFLFFYSISVFIRNNKLILFTIGIYTLKFILNLAGKKKFLKILQAYLGIFRNMFLLFM